MNVWRAGAQVGGIRVTWLSEMSNFLKFGSWLSQGTEEFAKVRDRCDRSSTCSPVALGRCAKPSDVSLLPRVMRQQTDVGLIS
jgi:hypothetical protein